MRFAPERDQMSPCLIQVYRLVEPYSATLKHLVRADDQRIVMALRNPLRFQFRQCLCNLCRRTVVFPERILDRIFVDGCGIAFD